jgi:hypothetical protein
MTLRQQDVVCLSSIDWDFIWQGHQEIMSTLAAEGHRVLFVENTGVRGLHVRDLPRVRQRVKNWWKGTKGFREERPNLFVFSPLLLPLPYSRVARWVNRFLLARALRRWMRAIGFYRPIVWTFLPTPIALDLIDDIDPETTASTIWRRARPARDGSSRARNACSGRPISSSSRRRSCGSARRATARMCTCFPSA